jgi:hypothetical protein
MGKLMAELGGDTLQNPYRFARHLDANPVAGKDENFELHRPGIIPCL